MRQEELAFGSDPTPQVHLGRGPRALESALQSRLAQDAASVRADPGRLALPLRIVVPSRSLQLHVNGVAARNAEGGALAGVAVSTLHAIALEILERAGVPAPPASTLLPVLVRRAVAAHPRLAPRLADLRDAEQAVEGGVHDLLDADLDPTHGPALAAAFEELEAAGAEAEPARSVVEIALFCLQEMDRCGIGHRSSLLGEATACVERVGADVLPARSLFFHGFANATGRVTELIRALQRTHSAEIWVDEPPAPDGGEAWPATKSFLAPFRERIESHPRIRVHEPSLPAQAARVRAIRALGGHGEARAVALELRALLDAGTVPERIAVVARDPRLHALPLRFHFERLGVPFSGLGTRGPGGAAERAARGLTNLLRERDALPAERWLDLRLDLDAAARADLDLALRHLGATRLRDVAELEVRGDVRLPVRAAPAEAEEGEGAGRGMPRRSLGAAVVRAAAERARRLCRAFEADGDERTLSEWSASLSTRLAEELGWSGERPAAARWLSLLSQLAESPGSTLNIDAFEFAAILKKRIAEASGDPLGGAGGGVQVLSVMEARARTFDHLFLLGLNRDAFPRSIQEDPLLPDAIRIRLRDVLPDLPVKGTGFDEERYLFSQLLASAPEVTVSWWEVDDDGRALARSPFVDLLRRACQVEIQSAPPWQENPAADTPGTPALERATRAGLAGRREAHERHLAQALREREWRRPTDGGHPETSIAEADALAAAHRAVLDEWDRFARPGVALGAYFGFVGARTEGVDPREGELFVTTLEAVGRCPWRGFLERVLRISGPPDPLEALPGATPLMVGSVVHAVLQRLGVEHGVRSEAPLAEVLALPGVPLYWPDDEEQWMGWVRDASAVVVAEEGGGGPGLVELLARVARAPVAAAIERGDPQTDSRVLGVEISGEIELPRPGARARTLRFRADRVARDESDRLILVDYKTGKPPADGVTEKTRTNHVKKAIARGESLQAAVYARATAGEGGGAEGRYVSLRPDLDPRRATVVVDGENPELRAALDHASAVLLDAYEEGLFPPRLLDAEKDEAPGTCDHCEVASACLQGDTGARRRLRQWTEERRAGAGEGDAEREERVLALWSLHRRDEAPAPDASTDGADA